MIESDSANGFNPSKLNDQGNQGGNYTQKVCQISEKEGDD